MLNKKSVQSGNVPLLVIVGPTASGKSALAMKVAQEYGGEIICADSRTIYKGMDVGTAKPSAEDRLLVPHWGLDIVLPGERFTAADFKQYALRAIDEIRSRGHVPILVGGTGLYVDGVIFDYEFEAPQPEVRTILEAMTLEELHAYCYNNNIELPENAKNKRYVMRAIELKSVTGKRLRTIAPHTLVVGITTDRNVLRQRITQRAEQLFADGMVEEARMLGKKYGWNSEAMTGNIYKLVKQFIGGEFDEAELQQKFITSDWQLAKRQLTWLKRNPFIQWHTLDGAYEFIKTSLGVPPGLPKN